MTTKKLTYRELEDECKNLRLGFLVLSIVAIVGIIWIGGIKDKLQSENEMLKGKIENECKCVEVAHYSSKELGVNYGDCLKYFCGGECYCYNKTTLIDNVVINIERICEVIK